MKPADLSPRQTEVIILIAKGLLNKEVAESLHISRRTVETHRAAAMRKLCCRVSADLVRWVVLHKLT